MHGRFPFWRPTLNSISLPDELISEKTVPLSKKAFESCIDTVMAYNEIRENKKYVEHIDSSSPSPENHNPGNYVKITILETTQ